MQTPLIEIRLSAGRSISFTAHHGHVQVIAEGGFIHPAELAMAKREAAQRLADAAGAPIRDDGAVIRTPPRSIRQGISNPVDPPAR